MSKALFIRYNCCCSLLTCELCYNNLRISWHVGFNQFHVFFISDKSISEKSSRSCKKGLLHLMFGVLWSGWSNSTTKPSRLKIVLWNSFSISKCSLYVVSTPHAAAIYENHNEVQKRHHFSQQWCVQDAAGTRFDWFPCSQYHHSLFLEQHLALRCSPYPPPRSSSTRMSLLLEDFPKMTSLTLYAKDISKKKEWEKIQCFSEEKSRETHVPCKPIQGVLN